MIWAAVAAALLGGALLYATMGGSERERADDGLGAAGPVSVETSLEGRTTCLPHKNAGGAQTLECAFGLESVAGDFYALDAGSLDPALAAELNASERVRVTGLLIPIEAVSTDRWQKYVVEGIMRVDSFEVI